jgi:hypothetical protein
MLWPLALRGAPKEEHTAEEGIDELHGRQATTNVIGMIGKTFARDEHHVIYYWLFGRGGILPIPSPTERQATKETSLHVG